MNIEYLIIKGLLDNEEYGRKVIAFLQKDYFTEQKFQSAFEIIKKYVDKFNRFPNMDAMLFELNESGESKENLVELLETLKKAEFKINDLDWMLDKTEKYIKERALYNAVVEAIDIIQNKHKTKDRGAIPEILKDALSVGFDRNIGHNWLEDYLSRHEYYHKKEQRIPFDLSDLNEVTKGGLPVKTLNIVIAGTGVGKSLFMCHCAARNILDGKNVLYITLEMAEERIAQRIDANILGIPINEIETLSKFEFETKIKNIQNTIRGRLIIKEYPTSVANVNHFRALLKDLKIKKSFIPDIIYVDYLNICSSARLKNVQGVNSYGYIKSIAEELRGLAVEYNVPLVTATQTVRSALNSSDIDISDTSESIGVPAAADFMIALISTDELHETGKIIIKQLKNRYNDIMYKRKFTVGVDRSKMFLYDIETDDISKYEEKVEKFPFQIKKPIDPRSFDDYQ